VGLDPVFSPFFLLFEKKTHLGMLSLNHHHRHVELKTSLFYSHWERDINFSNVLRAAFTRTDPESAKKKVKSSLSFALSGSACVKAERFTSSFLYAEVFFTASIYLQLDGCS